LNNGATRRFCDLCAVTDAKDIPTLEPLTQETRALTAEELTNRNLQSEQ
jgi:hypothetical protein